MTPRNRTALPETPERPELGSRFGRKHRTVHRSKPRTVRVLIAGQIPPPVSGQNLMIARVLGLVRKKTSFQVDHWAFGFTRTWSQVRRAGVGKVIEVFRVWGRLIKLRALGRIDTILYPVGGPHLAPIIRDLLLLPPAILCSRRVILHFHAAGLAEALPRIPAPIRFLISRIYRCCGEAVVLTEFGKRDPVAAGIPAGNTVVIPNACEDRFRPAWRKRPGTGEMLTILSVGLLCPDKGTPALIEAFSGIARERPEIRLRLVGEPMGGMTADSLLEIASRYGVADRVELSGVLRGEDLDRAYAEADLFVFSTVAPFESFGMVLIEAMMWGLPIVATDWRGNAEVMGPEPGGLLAAAEKDLAGSLEYQIGEALDRCGEWQKWGTGNRRRFLTEYQIESLEKRLQKIVEKN